MMRCEQCRYAFIVEKPNAFNDVWCRRRSPARDIRGIPEWDIFPKVHAHNSWCGEWEPATGRDEHGNIIEEVER